MDKLQINYYCDESCHLEHDKSRYMILGMVYCPKSKVKKVNTKIKQLKKRYDINVDIETKWSKISKSKQAYYNELINYFFNNNNLLSYRSVVVDKKALNHKKFNQTHNEFYYKMLYYLVNYEINGFSQHKIYIDERDTHNAERVKTLTKILKNNYKEFGKNIILPVQVIKSHEVEIMQLTDILTGAISYSLNNYKKISKSKVSLINKIQNKIEHEFSNKKNLNGYKFNIMYFKCKEQIDI